MESTNHLKNRFGIFYPNHIHGIGSPHDLLAFFVTIRLVSDQPESDYPLLWSLRRQPVFGMDMLPLFEEINGLRPRMQGIPLTGAILSKLGLKQEKTKLRTQAQDLAGAFERIFEILADDAPEFVKLASEQPSDNTLEWGSVRLGPIEPLIPSQFFQQLPASAFDDSDPPLWLRDEIFDEGFYVGKV